MKKSAATSRAHLPSAWARTATLGVAMALCVTACSSSTGQTEATGAGVPLGASATDYAEVLEDMDPIELRLQVALPKGQGNAVAAAAYAEAVEEWSGGKITMKIFYSSAVAPPGEDVAAFSDGRLDLGIVIPGASPELLPVSGLWGDADQQAAPDAVRAWLAMQFATLERGYGSSDFKKEYEGHGIRVLLPYMVTDESGLLCTESVAADGGTDGRQVRVGSPSHTPQVEALGMSPVSLPFTEVYEGLQRGVIDCSVGLLAHAKSSGLLDIADHWVGGEQALWATSYTPFGFSLATWERLPLAARQLLHDRLDVYVEHAVRQALSDTAESYEALEDGGGTVGGPLSEEAVEELKEVANTKLEEVRASGDVDGAELIEAATAAREKWLDLLGDAGYPEVPRADFVAWHENSAEVDLEPALDLLRIEILDPARPDA